MVTSRERIGRAAAVARRPLKFLAALLLTGFFVYLQYLNEFGPSWLPDVGTAEPSFFMTTAYIFLLPAILLWWGLVTEWKQRKK